MYIVIVLSTQKKGLCGHGRVWGAWTLLSLTLLLVCPWQVHNVAFAFELMLDGGLKKPKARPEDVVNLDLKSTLRVLYTLFTKYKDVE